MSLRRDLAAGLSFALAALALPSAPAEAQTRDAASTKLACMEASDKAQQLRLAGKLIAARDTLHLCVQDACPAVVREACSQWLGEVTASLPSIVIGARDGDGKDLLDVKVSIDGRLVAEHLQGLALPIDPGRHSMHYEKSDGAVVDEAVLIGEGSKNRAITVTFPGKVLPAPVAPPVAAPPHAGASGPSAANTITGAVLTVIGAAALGTALYLDLAATSDINALRTDPCAKTSTCSSSRVSGDQLDYDLAGVGLGVGVVALGVATYVFIARPFGTKGGKEPPAAFRVVPSPHGGGFALTF